MPIQHWLNTSALDAIEFRCGHCGREVGTNLGYENRTDNLRVYLCPRCYKASAWESGRIIPGAPYGNEVDSLPHEVAVLYKEARECVRAAAYSSAVLTCRKILMHVAVDQGADTGKNFITYVKWLADNGYVPPHGRRWVDHIRKRGNEANHEINVMEVHDAQELVGFVEMLLKFVYELPSRIPDDTTESEA